MEIIKEIIGLQLIATIIGFSMDLIIGDPHSIPHIVRLFGKVISFLEKRLIGSKNKRVAGTILVILTLLICVGAPAAILIIAYNLSKAVYVILESLIIWQCLAMKSLKDESAKVYVELEKEDIEQARFAVSMIVGRDTSVLDSTGVTKAAVETVAENASDGVGAPFFYILLFGALGGVLYKTVNTMDSMIGYKNDKYVDFGRSAARLDDLFNYLPSRLCALMMILGSFILGYDGKNAYRIWKRDRRNHASPNSAQTESVMAGALGIRLAGDAYYFGKLVKKPYIGDDRRDIRITDIISSHYLLYVTGLLFFIAILLIRGLIYAAI